MSATAISENIARIVSAVAFAALATGCSCGTDRSVCTRDLDCPGDGTVCYQDGRCLPRDVALRLGAPVGQECSVQGGQETGCPADAVCRLGHCVSNAPADGGDLGGDVGFDLEMPVDPPVESPPVSCTTGTPADSAPLFGGVSSALSDGPDAVVVQWLPAFDLETAPENIAYLVFVSTTSGGQDFVAPVAEVVGSLSFRLAGLVTGTTYYFVVRARDMAGNVDANTIERSGTTLAPTLSGDVQPIFTTICATSGCHAGARPAQRLDLSNGQTYSNVVGVWSRECTSVYRVEPSRPDTSYLVWKLQGSGACFSGSDMPGGSNPPLPQTQIDTIRAWIRVGAPNN